MKSVIVSIISFLVLVSNTYAQVLRPIDEVVIEDANGERIGKGKLHHDYPGFAEVSVIMEWGQHTFILGVKHSGFTEPDDILVYESQDCTGQPFLFSGAYLAGEGIFSIVAIAPPGKTLYVPQFQAIQEERWIQSQVRFGNITADNPRGCTLWWGQAVPVIIAKPTINLDTEFTPPFKIHRPARVARRK